MINPRLGLIHRIGPLSVYRVDGNMVRKTDTNFTDFGHHHSFPKLIPKNEMWMDKTENPKEDGYFITHMLKEHSLMDKGMPYDKALDAANKVEHRERNRMSGKPPKKAEIGKKHIGTTKGGLKIHLVDGEQVRHGIDPNFTEGGNDMADKYIPKGEVWLDNSNSPEEQKPNLLHELHERRIMKTKGLSYDAAHKKALVVEHNARNSPGTLDKRLGMELGQN